MGLNSGILFNNDGVKPAGNIVVKNCNILGITSSVQATFNLLSKSTVAGGYFNITINNNYITGSKFSIGITGYTGNYASNLQITNNLIGSASDADGIVKQGIQLQLTDNILIEGNEIRGVPSGNNGPQADCGILASSGTTNLKIRKNKIHDWINTTASFNYYAVGIAYGAEATSLTEISNNLIYNIKCPGTGQSNLDQNPYGIWIVTGGNVQIYHNSIYLSGNVLTTNYWPVSSCIALYSNVTQVDIRNNILKNSIQPTSGAIGSKSYGITAGTGATFTSNNNDFYIDGVGPNIGYSGGADHTTLANWQAATSQDANSVNADPNFTSPTNLLPIATATNAGINNGGSLIATVLTDILNFSRSNPPDMGAYEFTALVTDYHTLAATAIAKTTATLNGDINTNGEVVETYLQYGTTTSYGSNGIPVGYGNPPKVRTTTLTAFNSPLTGLTPNTTYHFQLKGTPLTSGQAQLFGADLTFTTLPLAPTVVTTAATPLTSTTAQLNGTVNPNGVNATVTIEWGLTTAYGNTVSATPGTVTGSTANPVMTSISGLTPYTTYHYRVVAANFNETTYGNDMTFITSAIPSTVVTLPASNIVVSSATLNGTVNANYAPTNVSFQWGLTTAYGNTVAATPTTVTGSTTTAVSAGITSLTFGTIYHFRCVGTGPGGTIYGTDIQFSSDCPTPAQPGTITGPVSVCRNTTGIIYSVTPVAGATGYNWIVPAGATITAGANTNSITVSYSTSATSGSVTVAGTIACGSGPSASLAVTVNLLPVPTITGPASRCQNTTDAVYTTQTGMTSYIWSVPGGTITAGAGTSSITVTWNTVGAQSVNVNYSNSNGCSAAAPVSYTVTVLPLPVPTISGANIACETTAYLDYTTEPGMTNYVWNMTPNSGTIAMTGTNVTTIFWTSPGAKWVSVSYTNANGCATATPTVYNVTVNPLPGTPGAISGQSAVCAGTNGVAYTIAAVTNATSYVWTLPAGATIATGAGTNSITVNYNATATSGNISVLAHNSCGDGQSSVVFPVVVNTVPVAPGTITGAATVCQGSNGITYSVAAVAGATSYAWTVPTGVTIATGAATNGITVNYSLTAISGNITVSGVNTCGTGTAATKAITVNTKPVTPVITQNVNILTSSAPTGNQWYRDGILIAGAVATTYTITQDGTYSVIVTLNGCSSDVSNLIVIIHTGLGNFETQDVNVYPNPNKGAFWLSIDSKTVAVYDMQVLNSLGAVVHHENNIEVNGSFKQYFDLGDLSAGMYTIVLRSDKQQIVKKIIVNK